MIDVFDIAAQSAVAVMGDELSYARGAEAYRFNILIERNLQVMDESSGATQYINAASFAREEFPLSRPQDGDTITAQDRTWRVVRLVSDDGYLLTVEVR